MKRKGASIIFVNNKNEILLLLRDNIPNIPYPNMWDLPGGHVEDNESPEESIIREMGEELDISLGEFDLFSVNEISDRIEYTFWKKVNFDINQLTLHEGQKIKWFTEKETKNAELAYGFNKIVDCFFDKKPYCIGSVKEQS
jgi:8-oxo-dGTP diphosphatase